MIIIEPVRNGKYIGDGAYHMAMQVWILENYFNLGFKDQTLVFPYISDPHVQIGYFQNPKVEINEKYFEKIQVVRRDTGGGAIYLDRNSACFCFIIPLKNQEQYNIDYQKFYEPAIKALNSIGVKNVYQKGKNDLTINDKKISGAALMIKDNLMWGGFSLLYDIDYKAMEEILKVNSKKVESKGINSIRQRVDKIKDHLDNKFNNLTIDEFKNQFLKKIIGDKKMEYFYLEEKHWKKIDELVAEKYKNWNWTYGLSPRYSYNREKRFDTGTINVSLEIENGTIKQIKISGDFFLAANKKIEDIENILLNCQIKKDVLIEKLKIINFENFFLKPIEINKFVEFILN
ncbi:lipoate--protein ligase [[Mycoplasma] collis]|uniref:lipoate--protein ligase n=1 Tax=[Mycoplasma] collis TaxID=2127 RepID=UPI00051BA530|nr:lipoate--protein ligase [[Mycoplasma] collis]